ncbi:MAG TPA: endolytic transglycosylase MltG [Pelomicrobium sp.]|nr:endolytic transglycosylase MltG [Pelomicrobium sp.]
MIWIRRAAWITLVLIAVAAALAGIAAWRLHAPVQLPGAGPVEFEIAPGSSLKRTAAELAQAGLLPEPALFVLAGRVLGRAGSIKAGHYQLARPHSPLELLDKFTRGDVTLAQITIIEGWTFRQLRAALDQHPDLRHETSAMSDADVLASLGEVADAPEGLFFPDTYFFSKNSTDLDVLRRARRTMEQHLQDAWGDRREGLPLRSPYEALILASIIEKETGREEDRAMIGGVFANRLRLGMKLQSDPTVIYGMGDGFDGNLRKRDLGSDTPFNTYTRAGLPPTPIALPGRASLAAATQPAETAALYFVARGDGSSVFSKTLDEHNQAVNRYQRR